MIFFNNLRRYLKVTYLTPKVLTYIHYGTPSGNRTSGYREPVRSVGAAKPSYASSPSHG